MIFISRNLAADSPLRAWALEQGRELLGRSLLRFEPVAFTPPADADWWFFYSSRAVAFGLAGGDPPAGTRLAAMGAGTAAALRQRGWEPAFTGVGYPEEVARQFGEVAAGRRVFFPRARQSRRSVQAALADRVTVLDAVCYDNVADPPPAPIVAEVYVYTSPLNVAAYLDHWAHAPGARVVAIGPSTAGALRERGWTPWWRGRLRSGG